jgi:glycosyltransferase involved in cell wall biosynthesis
MSLIASEYTIPLKVVGYCPDPEPFELLVNCSKCKIELYPAGASYSEIINLIKNCNLFILPSRTEAMGRVLLEAMAASRPIVATEVDGIPRVIEDRVSGILVPPESPHALAKGIEEVLRNRELAQLLGVNAHHRVRSQFSVAKFRKEYDNMVNICLSPGDF